MALRRYSFLYWSLSSVKSNEKTQAIISEIVNLKQLMLDLTLSQQSK